MSSLFVEVKHFRNNKIISLECSYMKKFPSTTTIFLVFYLREWNRKHNLIFAFYYLPGVTCKL